MLTKAQIFETALPILLKHRVKRAGLFGSYAIGTATDTSDVDLLVDPYENDSLLDLIGLKLELEDAMQRSVDLVDYKAIKPLIRDRILLQEIRFHG